MKDIALSNSICRHLGVMPQDAIGDLRHGQVCLANDSLFSQATYNVESTTYGIGYADPNRNQLIQLLNYLAPPRPGPRNATLTVYDETEPFEVIDYQTVKRSELGDFRTVKQRTSTKVVRKLVNRGLSIVLDNDQLRDKPNWQNMHTAYLIDLLTRASILEYIAVMTAAAAQGDVVWNGLANPDLDVKSTNVQVLAAATGFKANRVALGEDAALLRQIAYEQQNNAGSYARAGMMTDEQIATSMGVDRARTNVERYNNGGTKETFLGSKVLLFTAQDQESMEDNSNVVRHTGTTDMGGGNYATYIEERLKKTIITVENYELFAVQHTSGLALLNVKAN
jgi:hypothetical protein